MEFLESSGVKFYKNGVFKSFIISVEGDYAEYVNTISALLDTLYAVPSELQTENERYLICNLIKSMLPSAEQVEQLAARNTKNQ